MEKPESKKPKYIILGLKLVPAPERDLSKVIKAIISKINVWSRSLELKGQIPSFEQLKEDLTGLNGYIIWEKEIRDAQKYAEEQFEERLEVALKTQLIKATQLDHYKKNPVLANYFTPDEIEQKLLDRGVTIQRNDPLPIPVPKFPKPRQNSNENWLDLSITKKIEENLKQLNRADLYELLARPILKPDEEDPSDPNPIKLSDITDIMEDDPVRLRKASCDVLRRRAEEITQILKKCQTKYAQVHTYNALNTLCGQCISLIFKDETSRTNYDQYRQELPLKDLRTNFKQLIKGSTVLPYEQYDTCIEMAQEKGLSRGDAEWFVYELFQKEGVMLEPETVISNRPKVAKIQCPECGMLNDEKDSQGRYQAYCRQCKRRLRFTCPQCGLEGWTTQPCSACGFPLQEIPLLERHVHTLKQRVGNLKTSEDCNEVEQLLQKIRASWPQQPDLNALASQIDDVRKRFMREIDAERKRAEEETAAKYKQFMQDLIDQRRKLASKLQPPSAATAEVQTTGIRITWKSCCLEGGVLPSDCQIVYTLVRKENATPASRTDGETIARGIPVTEFHDTNAESGQIYGYRVFPSLRYDTRQNDARQAPSSQIPPHAAPGCIDIPQGTATAKVRRRDTVKNLQCHSRDSAIQLTWELPPHAVGVMVYRQEKSQSQSTITQSLVASLDTGSYLNDKGLQNEVTYRYLVRVRYRNLDGSQEENPLGETILATPHAVPSEVNGLKYKIQGTELRVTWTPLPSGESLRLYLAPREFSPVNQIFSLDDPIFSSQKALVNVDQQQGKALYQGQMGSMLYLIPVTCNAHAARIGTPLMLYQIPAVESISIMRNLDSLLLTWNWPEYSDEALLLYRRDTYPVDQFDRLSAQRRITREEYEKNDGFVLEDIGRQDCYFALYSVMKRGGTDQYSSPYKMRFVCAQSILSYQLKRTQWWFQKQPKYHLSISMKTENVQNGAQGRTLPALVLVQKNGTVPLKKNLGTVVFSIEAQNTKRLTVNIPADRLEPGSCVRLFLADENDQSAFVIEDPPYKTLRIS